MIAGEYAVLLKGSALAVTTDHFLECCSFKNQTCFELSSNLWPNKKTFESSRDLNEEDPFEMAVKTAAEDFCTVNVKSELELSHGVGSSSALRLAVLSAVKGKIDTAILMQAYELQKAAQGKASGYDLATQYHGGVIQFKAEENFANHSVQKISFKIFSENILNNVAIFVSEIGAPTTETIKKNDHWLSEVKNIVLTSEEFIESMVVFTSYGNTMEKLIAFRNILETAPSYPKKVHFILKNNPGFDKTWTFKPTGAGGDDAILLFGEYPKQVSLQLEKSGWKKASFNFADTKLSLCEQP